MFQNYFLRISILNRLLTAGLFLCSLAAQADETEVLTVDRIISHDLALSFSNDRNEKAKSSDFNLVNYVLMSNELGERWAVITLKNLASGTRVLENEHLIALFANGTRKNPLEFKLNFEAGEVQSITVSFGENKFPILKVNASV